MIVVDASAVVEVLLKSERATSAQAAILDETGPVHAPHILDIEVLHVLRRYAACGEMAPDRAQAAIGILTDLPIRRYPHLLLLPRVWQLRHNVSAYDAAYLVLAEILGATLMTGDRRLAAAAEGFAEVELI